MYTPVRYSAFRVLRIEKTRNSDSDHLLLLKFGQRCFSYAAPAAWNTLPPSLQLTNTDSFERQLKTVLFERAAKR